MIDFERIKQTKIEDVIFIIYYIIITLSLYANKVERNYLYTNNINSKNKYRNLLGIIFTIAVIVYAYYLYDNYKSLYKSDKDTYSLNNLSFIASLLVFISGLIYLYIIYKDENVDIELAFN